ncbi:cell division protein ZipA [Alteromonas sp. CYL-A6]|uniref:cell division protein ZipA n=1 Tax=Alteromonas nitratireducens TaxID=3390813 RepID=UPI0034C2F8D3
MEDQLRLSLLIAGTCFIVAVLAHGIWKIRKANRPDDDAQREEPQAWTDSDDDDAAFDLPDEHDNDDDYYDELGIGRVRVGKSQPQADDAPEEEAGEQDTTDDTTATENDEPEKAVTTEAPKKAEKLYGSVVTNPKPHMQAPYTPPGEADIVDFPEPPNFLLKTEEEKANAARQAPSEVDEFSLDTQPGQPEASPAPAAEPEAPKSIRKRSRSASPRRRQEPNFGDDQMRIDFDDQASEPSFSANDDARQDKPRAGAQPEQEVLVLNVRAKQDEPISGAALLPLLLTLGFKFGDQDIFHRHVNSNGKGPVLFSLANMFKPGNFDIDNLENFSTKGLSLFMILPIEGDPHQVFNMMHNAARKIADEFDAQVLDGRRSVLTRQGLQQYAEKIREFERQRMIARH